MLRHCLVSSQRLIRSYHGILLDKTTKTTTTRQCWRRRQWMMHTSQQPLQHGAMHTLSHPPPSSLFSLKLFTGIFQDGWYVRIGHYYHPSNLPSAPSFTPVEEEEAPIEALASTTIHYWPDTDDEPSGKTVSCQRVSTGLCQAVRQDFTRIVDSS